MDSMIGWDNALVNWWRLAIKLEVARIYTNVDSFFPMTTFSDTLFYHMPYASGMLAFISKLNEFVFKDSRP